MLPGHPKPGVRTPSGVPKYHGIYAANCRSCPCSLWDGILLIIISAAPVMKTQRSVCLCLLCCRRKETYFVISSTFKHGFTRDHQVINLPATCCGRWGNILGRRKSYIWVWEGGLLLEKEYWRSTQDPGVGVECRHRLVTTTHYTVCS